MPNKNYLRGRAKEYYIKKKYEKMGYICLRTAGSHGFADIIAIDPMNNRINFIQCKPKKYSKKKIFILEQAHGWLDNKAFVCYFEVI